MRRSYLPLFVVLALGCDEQERNPPPPGTSAGSAGSVGNSGGGSSSPSSDTGDDDEPDGDDTGAVSVSGGDMPGGDTGGAAEGDEGPGWQLVETSTDVVGWAVGADGTVIRFDQGSAAAMALPGGQRWSAVASPDGNSAWIVGQGRGLVHARDDGHWRPSSVRIDAEFDAIASDGQGHIIAAGDRWLAVSRDDGLTFEAVRAPASFTAIAPPSPGREVALLIDDAGSIWRYELERRALERTYRADEVELRAIAFRGDATRAVAVGDEGAWLESFDGGRSWQASDAGTARDLVALDVSPAGDVAVAVGRAGVVVTWDAFGFRVQELHDDESFLRGVAVASDGQGLAVGDAGHVWATDDAGLSWRPIDVPIGQDLHAVAIRRFDARVP